MKPGIKTEIHNRFDIYKTNIKTGKTEHIAFAENIVLNSIWSRLVNRQNYFVNIHYGTGTGTLSASRTSLFTHLGTRVAADDTLTKALPVSSWRRKIILNPEDNVGAILTEIGIGYDGNSGSLMTHAMLKDMNGNTVSITKTAVDLLTIYATVYVTFSTTDPNLQICGLPDSNPLINYLIGGSAIGSCYFYTGETSQVLSPGNAGIITTTVLGTTAAVIWTADIANKKMTTSTQRFDVNSSNGHIKEISFGSGQLNPIFRILLPASSIYTGLVLAGVNVGVGDGATKDFVLPSRNIRSTGLKIYIDGTETLAFTRGRHVGVTLVRKDAPFLDAFSTSRSGTCFSRNGKIFSCASGTDGSVYTFDYNTTLKAKANASVAGIGYDTSLSDDGLVLAVSHANAPYITTFDWVAGAWIKRPDPSILPTGIGRGCALSGDGLVLAVAHDNSPFLTTYDWTSGAWVKRANPAILPTGNGYAVTLSQNGFIMAIAHTASPFLTTYDWTAGAWVKRTNPVTLPTGDGKSCDITNDGALLVVGHDNSPFLTTYDWTSGAWVKRANPTTLPNGSIVGCAIAKTSGTILAIVNSVGNPNDIEIYDWIAGAWVRRTPTTTAKSSGNSCAMTPDEKTVIATHTAGMFSYNNTLSMAYEIDAYTEKVMFDTAPATGAVITADYTVDGIHKTNQRVIDLSAIITFGEPT